jgi:LAGLIDADG DNA endonuclease family protein
LSAQEDAVVGRGYPPVPARLLLKDGPTPIQLLRESVAAATQADCLSLLRTKGLSIRGLDEKKKEELRDYLDYLHNTKGLSLNDIAKLVGNKTSGYTSWVCQQLGVKRRPFEEARLKGIREKRRKYERKPFDGTDEDRAYLLGLRHGDLSVSRPWKGVVRVSTSTTHPAMAQLFRVLFEPYGHVYQLPRYKKDTDTYEWNLTTIVDNSFEFILQSREAAWAWVETKLSTLLAYLAGVLDAEGSIGIYGNGSTTALQLLYYNTNLDLLKFIHGCLVKLGYGPLGPYLDKKKGTTTSKYRIVRRKDYWKIALARFNQVQDLLPRLPIRHPEKVARKEIALSLLLGQPWNDVAPRIEELRKSIRVSRDAFVEEARASYLEHRSSNKGAS